MNISILLSNSNEVIEDYSYCMYLISRINNTKQREFPIYIKFPNYGFRDIQKFSNIALQCNYTVNVLEDSVGTFIYINKK